MWNHTFLFLSIFWSPQQKYNIYNQRSKIKIKEIHHWQNQLSTRLLPCVKCWALTKRLLIACNLAQSWSSACIIKNKIIAVLSSFFFQKEAWKLYLGLYSIQIFDPVYWYMHWIALPIVKPTGNQSFIWCVWITSIRTEGQRTKCQQDYCSFTENS